MNLHSILHFEELDMLLYLSRKQHSHPQHSKVKETLVYQALCGAAASGDSQGMQLHTMFDHTGGIGVVTRDHL